MPMLLTCSVCLGPWPGTVDQFGQHVCAPVIGMSERVDIPERTPDGHPQVWLLYRPEPFEIGSDDDRSIHLWVRRCDVFTSRGEAAAFLDNLIGRQVTWRPYDPLFPELWIGEDRGQRWLMTSAPLNPMGGQTT